MKVCITLLTTLLTLAAAGPIHVYDNAALSNASFGIISPNATAAILAARGSDVMKGKCDKIGKDKKYKACKVNMKSYSCKDSHCDKKGAPCVVAYGMTLFEAKCPVNELPFEWNWPWKPI